MRIIGFALVLAVFGAQFLVAQTVTPEAVVDWSTLNPKILDLADDELDALDLEAEVIDQSEIAFAPRKYEADKIFLKLKRIKVSSADDAVYTIFASYAFRLSTCRGFWNHNTPSDICSYEELSKVSEEAAKALKNMHREYSKVHKKVS